MINLLVANGCSLVRGAELDDPAREAWPALLAARLGVPVVNLGCDCGSNRRIVRTTVTNLDRVCREAGVPVDQAMVVCMWTGLDRAEFCRPGTPDHGGPGHVRPALPHEDSWLRTGNWRIGLDQQSTAYYRHVWTQPGAAVNWLLDWLLLDGYLRARGTGVRYLYGWDTAPAKPTQQEQELMSTIDLANVYGGRLSSAGNSFVDLSRAHGFPFGPAHHPLAAAHQYLAEQLTAWLRPALG
jgi:hypothetical protein